MCTCVCWPTYCDAYQWLVVEAARSVYSLPSLPYIVQLRTSSKIRSQYEVVLNHHGDRALAAKDGGVVGQIGWSGELDSECGVRSLLVIGQDLDSDECSGIPLTKHNISSSEHIVSTTPSSLVLSGIADSGLYGYVSHTHQLQCHHRQIQRAVGNRFRHLHNG